MKKRVISGAVFFVVLFGFFLLRTYVHPILFNVLIWFFSAVGTFEVARACRKFVSKESFYISIVFGLILIPVYVVSEYVLIKGYGFLAALALAMLFLDVILFGCDLRISNSKKSFYSILPIIYPGLLLIAMATLNSTKNGFIGLLLVFVISPFTDVCAYLVGMAYNKLKKGNAKKLCPKLSPKKTWAGAIGGTIGGLIGSILIYIIFRPKINFFSPILFFIIIGLVGSILTQIGDLTESAIKRSVGIKDMGKIMPGHGGIMDRIDGISMVCLFILIVLLLV